MKSLVEATMALSRKSVMLVLANDELSKPIQMKSSSQTMTLASLVGFETSAIAGNVVSLHVSVPKAR